MKQRLTMNRNRKNRLNLSLVRKSESPKSPVRDRSRTSIKDDSTTECNTPLNPRKRSSTFSDGSPVMNDYDSPIPMSQDTSNMVTGVSWAWNSPKRAIPDECRPKPRPLLVSNNILPPKEPDLRKKTTERLVGFYKFQMELKKIQAESQNNAKKDQNKPVEAKPPSPSSPNGTDLFDSFSENEALDDEPTVVVRDQLLPVAMQTDSFNDSAFDSLLLQASQAAEKKSQPLPEAVTHNEGPEKTPMKRKSLFKSRTINDLDSFAVNDLLNDSVDFCLIEASQMVESTANVINVEQKTAEPSGSKKTSSLTRHKSMPASPSQKVPVQNNTEAPTNSLRSKFDVNFLKNDSSSSAASTTFPQTVAPPPMARLCTKEEIEQKRQEALKRQQARRLYKLGGLGNNAMANVRKS